MAMAWPARPSVIPRSLAIGVSRLTGMNSDAISVDTQRVSAATAPHAPLVGRSDGIADWIDMGSHDLGDCPEAREIARARRRYQAAIARWTVAPNSTIRTWLKAQRPEFANQIDEKPKRRRHLPAARIIDVVSAA